MMQITHFEHDLSFENDTLATDLFTSLDLGYSTTKYADIITGLFGDAQDSFDFQAICDCGRLTGNHYTEKDICPVCGTTARHKACTNPSYRGWIDVEGTLGCPVLHPLAYNFLSKWLGSVNKVKILDALLDPTIELPESLQELGQGYRYFYNNYDNIVRFFQSFTPKRKPYPEKTIKTLGDNLFVTKLPVLNSALHIMTKHGKLRLADKTASSVIDALLELSDCVYRINATIVKDNYIDQQLLNVYRLYHKYATEQFKTKTNGKEGLIRKQVLAGRCHNTFRSVITPITEQHSIDEIHLPWKVVLETYKLQILNILTNRMGYSMENAVAKHVEAMQIYDPEIDEVIKTLIKESPFKTIEGDPGLPILYWRPPVLGRHSIMLLLVTLAKIKLYDETASISARILRSCNGDFDGDEMPGLALSETAEIEVFDQLRIEYAFIDYVNGGISDNVIITDQNLHSLNAYINADPTDNEWLQQQS
ncbi:MAG: hypothetical protein GY804_09280 [Alphaproteobacteria bacterium]|nr:hypothetical protein [Alphaproteobacteria bacterium]